MEQLLSVATFSNYSVKCVTVKTADEGVFSIIMLIVNLTKIMVIIRLRILLRVYKASPLIRACHSVVLHSYWCWIIYLCVICTRWCYTICFSHWMEFLSKLTKLHNVLAASSFLHLDLIIKNGEVLRCKLWVACNQFVRETFLDMEHRVYAVMTR